MTFDLANANEESTRVGMSQFGLLRQMATIAAGSALGQCVVLATTPLLARIYSPAEFGEYAAFLAMCNVFVTAACLRYDAALNASDDRHTGWVFGVACFAAVGTAMLVFLIAWSSWGRDSIDRVIGRQVDATWIAAAAVSCGVYQATSTMAIRNGQFGRSSLLRAGQPMVFSIAAIVLPIGLISSCLLGFLTALPLAARYVADLRSASGGAIARAAWRFREFPMMSLPTSILDALSLALPIWFITAQYSSMDAGNYAQVQRLVAAPLVLFAIAMGQVFLKRAGDLVRAGQSARAFQRRVVMYLVGGACALAVAIELFFSPLLSLLLGHNWRTDTAFLMLVFAPVAVRSSVSPVTGIFLVRNRLRICATWQIFYFVVTASIFYYLAGQVSLEYLLAAYAVSETVCYGLYLYLADRVAE
ncbi:lipopolysaccharide biosynthesis protein [Bradyrhizobium sp. AZCC 2289]|uniref:lipopolysaccharide biosynthesis protein n=1 Tax=Bradyrhizobium sp. AZCC 2289 TaxID=3117026 RepID=UPI002FF389D5